MTILNVTDPEFTNYGRIIEGYEAEKKEIVEALKTKTPIPEGTEYVAEEFFIWWFTYAVGMVQRSQYKAQLP